MATEERTIRAAADWRPGGGEYDDIRYELAAHCRRRLAAFKVPKRFIRMRELPRNEAGKVVRRRLPHARRRYSHPP